MIKPEEFRLGNLIQSDGEYFIIDRIENNFIGARSLGVHPAGFDLDLAVPLSMEWLLKFGFTTKTQDKYGNLNFWNKEKDVSIDIDLTVSFVNVEPLFYYRVHETVRRKPLRYVHQLQNLYFALTGSELTLQP